MFDVKNAGLENIGFHLVDAFKNSARFKAGNNSKSASLESKQKIILGSPKETDGKAELLKEGNRLFSSIVAGNVKQRPMVAPVGNLIGVRMNLGKTCIGVVETLEKKELNIRAGDFIVAVNGEEIDSLDRIADIISKSNGQSLQIEVQRYNKKKIVNITPKEVLEGQRYMLGIIIRDCSIGLGTLTYYDASAKCFGAIGHNALDENCTINNLAKGGKIYDAAVKSVIKSKFRMPGRIIYEEFGDNPVIGEVYNNNNYGVFGSITAETALNNHYSLPIASKSEIKLGPAAILSNIEGKKVEEFTATIENILPKGDSQGAKNLLIKITDPRLIKKTGGIVQGMSGSPVIQNDKLVGAISHVMVEDPRSGYGVFAESMFENAEKESCRL